MVEGNEQNEEREEKRLKPTVILLVRHGDNDWVGDRLAGWTPDVHLNDQGRRQAEILAQRLVEREVEVAAVYSSPLERTMETAQILAKAFELDVQMEEGIGESRYGEWTGKELKELAETDVWKSVQFYPSGTRFPGGESVREIQSRAVAALDAIREVHREEVVIAVSHADVIKSIVAHYIGLHLDLFQRLVVSTASLTVLVFGGMGIPRLVRFNDTSHVPPEEHAESEDEESRHIP